MSRRTDRWTGRPVLGALVSVSIVALPLLAALAVAVVSRGEFPAPHSVAPFVLWLLAQLTLSALTYAGTARLTRRLLPLAALLKMTLVFPDQAPSRLAVAGRASSVRHLDARVDHARDRLASGTPGEAAAIIIELIGALGHHDRRTRGHSERVRAFTDLVADELDLPESTRNRLRWSALLHDIGKLSVHSHILNKPGKLDPAEWEIIRTHPLEGARLAAPLAPWLGEWSKTIEQHHEKYDGTGYPFGLAGSEISYGGRIVAVADAFEVMTAKRSYKDAVGARAAREELTRCAGTHFDPEVVRAFLNVSLGRLWWTMGPAALLAQLPVLGDLPFVTGRATGALSVVSSGTAVGAFTLGAAGLMGTAGLPAAAATAPHPAVVAVAQSVSAPRSVDQAAPMLSFEEPATTVVTVPTVVTSPTSTAPATITPPITLPPVTVPIAIAPPITLPAIIVPPTPPVPEPTVPSAPGLLERIIPGLLQLFGKGP